MSDHDIGLLTLVAVFGASIFVVYWLNLILNQIIGLRKDYRKVNKLDD
jgi:hypothetical protein